MAIVVESESYTRNVELLKEVLKKADLWAKQYTAKFTLDKFELIHFKNPHKQPDKPFIIQQPTDIYDLAILDLGTD